MCVKLDFEWVWFVFEDVGAWLMFDEVIVELVSWLVVIFFERFDGWCFVFGGIECF